VLWQISEQHRPWLVCQSALNGEVAFGKRLKEAEYLLGAIERN
jgi:hypothetical protein